MQKGTRNGSTWPPSVSYRSFGGGLLRFLVRWLIFFGALTSAFASPMSASTQPSFIFAQYDIVGHAELLGVLGASLDEDVFNSNQSMVEKLGSAFARIKFHSTALFGDREFESEQPNNPIQVRASEHLTLLSGKHHHHNQFERVGEASNPGPNSDYHEPYFDLVIGSTNTTGLRQKEAQILELGEGIWSMAETHLTKETYRTSKAQFRNMAKQFDRYPRLLIGAPTNARTNSKWAGSWSGVAQLSDFACSPLKLDIPSEHWDTARLLTARHWCYGTPITISTVYGYPQGPSWPKAKTLTNELLRNLTTNMVLGMQGVRLIVGDYNNEPEQLREQQIWKYHGWANAQCLAQAKWNQTKVFTCKNATERDQIWLSPEAQLLLSKVEVTHDFIDHSTVKVVLSVPTTTTTTTTFLQTWPRPSRIDWPKNVESYQNQTNCHVKLQHDQPEVTFSGWATDFERGVNEAFANEGGLPGRCFGRGQRLQPVKLPQSAPTVKPSRQGEIALQHDLIGGAVRAWFRQARKLQSLLFALRGGKTTLEALEYRVTLWSSILRSKGFQGGFKQWWNGKEALTPDGGLWLPTGVPNVFEIEIMYLEFMEHFRRFENIHLRARGKALQEKYESSTRHLFRELRPPASDAPDLFWEDVIFEVVDHEETTGEIRLEPAPIHHVGEQWIVNGQNVQISNFDGACCKIRLGSDVGIGDTVCQRIFTSSITEMHSKLLEYWRPRWQRISVVPPDQWTRITLFAKAYIPKINFDWQPITVREFREAAKKMKLSAARGPDGVARLDIVNMAHSHLQFLVDMLTCIERGQMKWPSQLLLGFVICIAKTSSSSSPSGYRPITLFGVAYRLWASLRTRQLLIKLQDWLPDSILGFMPKKETAQVWQVLQGMVEVSINEGLSMTGLSADLAKAFNFIGREQTFFLARHAGFPDEVTVPWSEFVGNVCRRFDLRGHISEPITSSSGFPEGCPMSIISMLLANWAHHQYVAAYEPQVTAFSYVDNLTLVAPNPQKLLAGLFATTNFYELWGLSIDQDKTMVWALDTKMRKELRHMSHKVVLDARELGGIMNYSKCSRIHKLTDRNADLADKWTRLRKSSAPQCQKIQCLPIVFWSSILHGASNRNASTQFLLELRRQASKAIGLTAAGTNPMLKLSLTDTPKADPGFYQLTMVLSNFSRLLGKSSEFRQQWEQFRNQPRHGAPGPFSTFLVLLQDVNWTVLDDEHLIDHRGTIHHIWHPDQLLLLRRLHEAWLQKIAAKVKHKTMDGLHGLEPTLTMIDTGRMTRLERSRLLALHSGAFMSCSQKAKYDKTQDQLCSNCNAVDDRVHWLCCPRFAQYREHFPWDWPEKQKNLPKCTLYHLLVPWLPELHTLDMYYEALPLGFDNFQSLKVVEGTQHLFLDGTCQCCTSDLLAFAAWGVIHAGTGELIMAEHLQGPRQASDRAEISAMIASLAWCITTHTITVAWSDSLSTVKIAGRILQTASLQGLHTNLDLWHRFWLLAIRAPANAFLPKWIPSHQDPELAEDPFEEWCAEWNGKVDRMIDRLNKQRPEEFWTKHLQIQDTWKHWCETLRVLRQFYFNVATETGGQKPGAAWKPNSPVLQEDDHSLDDSLIDCIPLNWRSWLTATHRSFPESFACRLVEKLAEWDEPDRPLLLYSDVEICVALVCDRSFCFPTYDSQLGRWNMKAYADHFERPLVTRILRVVSDCLDHVVGCFGLDDFRVGDFENRSLGIFRSGKACYLRLPHECHEGMRSRLATLVSRRPIRKAADLARPL